MNLRRNPSMRAPHMNASVGGHGPRQHAPNVIKHDTWLEQSYCVMKIVNNSSNNTTTTVANIMKYNAEGECRG